MKILGIAGTNGSGKDSLAALLKDDYGWFFVSSSGDLIIPELKRLGRPLEREQMSALTTEWRQKEGMGAVVDRAVKLCESSGKKYEGLVVGSLRHPGEVQRVHELGGKVVWVDASPHVRYERIYSRAQGDKDQKTYQQFLAEEKAEMDHSGDDATLNMAAVKKNADIFIENGSNDLEAFKAQVKKTLNL